MEGNGVWTPVQVTFLYDKMLVLDVHDSFYWAKHFSTYFKFSGVDAGYLRFSQILNYYNLKDYSDIRRGWHKCVGHVLGASDVLVINIGIMGLYGNFGLGNWMHRWYNVSY